MDVKGLAWIGNIYDKFEAMCLELEEHMYEDTAKYVENQVQTVGASVKRFYSEVMQDLHSESCIDPVKVAAADLSLNPYAHPEMKQNANVKKDAKESEHKSADDTKVISGNNKTGVYRRPIASRKGNYKANFLPPASGMITPNVSSSQIKRTGEVASGRVDVIFPSAGGASRNANENNSKHTVDTGPHMSHASATKTIVSFESTGQKQDDSTATSSSGGLLSDYSGTCTNSGAVSQKKPFAEMIIMDHQERVDNCSTDAAKNDYIIDPEVEIVEPFNESNFEETCVLVEEDKLHFFPQGQGSHKSYKKKLRKAFSSKMRLTRKEYEELAAKCTEQNSIQDNAERMMPDRPPADSPANTLPAQSSESEWELL